MKKVVLFVLGSLMIVSCGPNKAELELERINTEIESIFINDYDPAMDLIEVLHEEFMALSDANSNGEISYNEWKEKTLVIAGKQDSIRLYTELYSERLNKLYRKKEQVELILLAK